MPCQNVSSTGPDVAASSSASVWHGGSESSRRGSVVGGAVVIGGTVVCPGTVVPAGWVVAGEVAGARSLPACRMLSPDPHEASTTHVASTGATARLIPSPPRRSARG